MSFTEAEAEAEADAIDAHPECAYCSRPAVISSAVGLEGDYSEPNALGQRQYIAPRAESRCEECHEGFIKSERRAQRLAEEGWI